MFFKNEKNKICRQHYFGVPYKEEENIIEPCPKCGAVVRTFTDEVQIYVLKDINNN